MNSEEGVSLAKMAVTVLLVVLVIGAVVAVVYAAYSWFNSGTSKLGDQVTSIDKSAYSQYDDTQVSGTDVLSALKAYRESEIGIFIANSKATGNTAFVSAPASGATVQAMNYCALAGGTGNGASTVTPTKTGSNYLMTVTYDGSQWGVTAISYKDAAGNDTAVAMSNTNFSPTTQTNNAACYVKQSAKWYSNLVYSSETGDVCGILFRQMN